FLLPVAGTVHSDERRRDFPRPMRRRPTIVYRAAMPPALAQWSTGRFFAHEEALSRSLPRNCSRRAETHDLPREFYGRVYGAAARSLPDRPGPFLFAPARHLLADRARRARVVSIETVGDSGQLNVLVDELSPERWCGGRQVLRRLADAFDRLPERCREVAWLRRAEELSQQEVAARMGISEKTVEKHIAKGMRLIAERFYGGEAERPAAALPQGVDAQKQAD